MFDLYSSCVCLYAGILKECLKWQTRKKLKPFSIMSSIVTACCVLKLSSLSVWLHCWFFQLCPRGKGTASFKNKERPGKNRDRLGCSILSEVMNEGTLPSTTSMHALFLGGGVCDSKGKPSKAWNMLLFCVEKTQFRRLHLLFFFFFFPQWSDRDLCLLRPH